MIANFIAGQWCRPSTPVLPVYNPLPKRYSTRSRCPDQRRGGGGSRRRLSRVVAPR